MEASSEGNIDCSVGLARRYALPDKCLRAPLSRSFNYGAGPFVTSGQLHSRVARL